MNADNTADVVRTIAAAVLTATIAVEWAGYRIAERSDDKALAAVGDDETLLPEDYAAYWNAIPDAWRTAIDRTGTVALVVTVAATVAGWFL